VERVYVIIRPKGPFGADERFTREVASSPCLSGLPGEWTNAVEVVTGSLGAPGLDLDPARREAITARATHVVHAAAAVDFGLPLVEAARSNVETTLNLLELARACRSLRRFVSVSTAYVTPHTGNGVPIEETLAPLPVPADELYRSILDGRAVENELLARTGHPNTYTLTKSLAEHLVVARRGEVPLAIVRPSIISASRRHPFPGWIDSIAGFASFVILLGMGQMRAVIADPDARLDIVPVDDVVSRILLACQSSEPNGGAPVIRHAVAGLASSATVYECWEQIRDFFTTHRIDYQPSVTYMGPPGVRFALADALHHRPKGLWAPRARRGKMQARVAQLNAAFPYFTRRSFAFRAAVPLDDGFDPHRYVAQVCSGVYRHVLGRDDTGWLLAGRRHRGHRGDARWVGRQPHGSPMIRATAWASTKVLRRSFERVTVDLDSFRAARAAAPDDSPLVIVPSHRSYFDFVLCSYLFFARPDLGIPIPYVAAATEFGRIPVLGRVLNALHAFYVARGPRRENKELAHRVHAILRAGKTIEFFIEGTRSRSRAFLSPKRGLLRCVQTYGKTCTLLPVSITYDRVPEEASFARELAGAPKPPMRLGALVAWTQRALRGKIDLGRVHLACGEPVQLGPHSDVHAVSRDVIARLEDGTVTTTYHLRTFLAAHPIDGVDVKWLRRAIEQRGGRVLDSTLASPSDLHPLTAASYKYQFAHLFRGDHPSDDRVRRLLEVLFGSGYPGATGGVGQAEPAA
jgi:1-acyl-sn-glycerol-3-phosphate acyltransferase